MTAIKYYDSGWKNLLPSNFGWYIDTAYTRVKNNISTPTTSNPTDITGDFYRWDSCIFAQIWANTIAGYWTDVTVNLPSNGTFTPTGKDIELNTTVINEGSDIRIWGGIYSNGVIHIRTHGPVQSRAYSGQFFVTYPAKNIAVGS